MEFRQWERDIVYFLLLCKFSLENIINIVDNEREMYTQ